MTDAQLLNAFENADDLTDVQLNRVATIEPRYAAMIEALRAEDAIAADVDQHLTAA